MNIKFMNYMFEFDERSENTIDLKVETVYMSIAEMARDGMIMRERDKAKFKTCKRM